MELNPQTIEYIKNKVSILDVIAPYVSITKKGNRYFACCPFHNEKTPSFTIDIVRNRFHCFGCGASGDSINFLMEYNSLSFVDAVKELANKASVEITISKQNSEKHKQKKQEQESLFSIMECAKNFFMQSLQKDSNALAYVKSRFLSSEHIKNFELGYSPNGFDVVFNYLTSKGFSKQGILKCGLAVEKNGKVYDMFRNRIMFPINNVHGKTIAFGARSFDGSNPKYLNSKETPLFAKKENLYGIYNVLKSGSKFSKNSIIVAEGYLDVIKLHKYGFNNALAPLGTALTESHINVLKRFSKNHLLCFDGDNAGLNAGLKTALMYLKQSSLGLSPRFIILPNKQDPDDFLEQQGSEKFEELIKESYSLFEFLWYNASLGKNLNNPDDLIFIERNLKQYFKDIDDFDVKKIYLSELESRIRKISFKKTTGKKAKQIELVKALNNATNTQDVIKEKILLAYLLKHTYLIDEHSETLCRIKFEDKIIEKIFHDILSIDFEACTSIEECFADKDYFSFLKSNILCSDILALEPQIEGDYEAVSNAFDGLLKNFIAKEIDKEINLVYSEFLKEDLASGNYSRLVNLKKLQK